MEEMQKDRRRGPPNTVKIGQDFYTRTLGCGRKSERRNLFNVFCRIIFYMSRTTRRFPLSNNSQVILWSSILV